VNDLYKEFLSRLEKSNDSNRKRATEKRHAKGFRTARENLDDLVDKKYTISDKLWESHKKRKLRNLKKNCC